MEAIGIGVSEFLLKPVDIDALIAALERKSRDIILEKELDRQRKRFETIINFQDNMIFLTDGEKIVDANKSFLSFFAKSSAEEFEAEGNALDYYFIDETDIIHKIDGENWIKNFLDGKFSKDVVKIKSPINDEVKTFLVKATKFPDEEPELDIISMSDITEMEKEAKILERLANTDPLTKIYNRLKLNELLNYEIKKTDRYKTPISLIMFDIDRFKNINDTFGHDVGDEVLIAIARAVEQNIRSTDVLARWGGEEFMIMLPNTDEAGAHIMAENLRKLIASLKFEKFDFVTASFGVAQYEDDGTKEFLKRVDNALYEAKRGGRNMVSIG
jgi:diguanylate cyclase (GGDEF)-like protein